MIVQSDNRPSPAAELRGDPALLLAHLNAIDESEGLSLAALAIPRQGVCSVPALRSFLENYGR